MCTDEDVSVGTSGKESQGSPSRRFDCCQACCLLCVCCTCEYLQETVAKLEWVFITLVNLLVSNRLFISSTCAKQGSKGKKYTRMLRREALQAHAEQRLEVQTISFA